MFKFDPGLLESGPSSAFFPGSLVGSWTAGRAAGPEAKMNMELRTQCQPTFRAGWNQEIISLEN